LVPVDEFRVAFLIVHDLLRCTVPLLMTGSNGCIPNSFLPESPSTIAGDADLAHDQMAFHMIETEAALGWYA